MKKFIMLLALLFSANRVLVYRPENRESGATGNFQGPMPWGYHPARKNAAAG